MRVALHGFRSTLYPGANKEGGDMWINVGNLMNLFAAIMVTYYLMVESGEEQIKWMLWCLLSRQAVEALRNRGFTP